MTTSSSINRDQEIQNLRELIADIDSGMLTTVDEDGTLHSCPMSTNGNIDADGVLWFFIYSSSHKATEIKHHQYVNVSFVSPDRQRYISISGTGQLLQDRNKIEEKWKPQLQMWFPKGLDEPDLTLLKVNVNKADYWQSTSSFKPKTIIF
ncbi:pyridoxamine 5'-phosphate oxidase family protein [Nostoc sp. UHCC 0870]|uniref:pyridoxamine 5'-phosphate oxidase family protein n=1 Tax=Nostoc sp. UHCC 0870 TaxID=2914041 RepID=UPI001EE0ACFF|nr:pyridoxamine 5'-phosphate oxidase family protein [Nostoc sp. UHCC 0870]UKP01199.1 pyridoxamine 5'-phosphate oxidase family protein [Nostoc sp. UHCC 0870]